MSHLVPLNRDGSKKDPKDYSDDEKVHVADGKRQDALAKERGAGGTAKRSVAKAKKDGDLLA